eukprot:1171935-Amphidinium_carterae.3
MVRNSRRSDGRQATFSERSKQTDVFFSLRWWCMQFQTTRSARLKFQSYAVAWAISTEQSVPSQIA